MSNQEAIALLRNLEDSLDSYCELNEEGKTAFRMAIEALSGSEIPNSSDTISRQAALDAIDTWPKYGCNPDGRLVPLNDDEHYVPYVHYDDMVKVLKSLPSARRWIPCSERMPDSSKQVLVYARSVHYALAKYDEMREADGSYKKQWVTFDAWKPFYTIKEVIAWQPLPEPYKVGEK